MSDQMGDQNAYDTLGLTESSSFEDIQAARDRLVNEFSGDRKQTEIIEAAYDAILMERLRLRQEGKIKVPDRIRYPEKTVELPPKPLPASTQIGSEWLQGFLDTPSREDIIWPSVIFSGLALVALFAAPLSLALGVGSTIYFLNRKEHRLGRAVLITVIGAVVGLSIGLSVGQLLIPQGAQIDLQPEELASILTFVVLWMISSFLR
ncbi:MAG: CPP1-like family protein [Leptolyngbyaceae cyanobacterium MO_188.B28]|nr:CPP1-like family protein [Leptolyngbyaceae cyanobacterium MO_188.B28]